MAEYELEIEVTANRIAAPDEIPVGNDGILPPGFAKMMKEMSKSMKHAAPSVPGAPLGVPGEGLAFRKVVIVRVESFVALADLLGKFEHLAEQLEIESQVNHS